MNFNFLSRFESVHTPISDSQVRKAESKRIKEYHELIKKAKAGDKRAVKILKERYSLRVWSKEEITRVYG